MTDMGLPQSTSQTASMKPSKSAKTRPTIIADGHNDTVPTAPAPHQFADASASVGNGRVW